MWFLLFHQPPDLVQDFYPSSLGGEIKHWEWTSHQYYLINGWYFALTPPTMPFTISLPPWTPRNQPPQNPAHNPPFCHSHPPCTRVQLPIRTACSSNPFLQHFPAIISQNFFHRHIVIYLFIYDVIAVDASRLKLLVCPCQRKRNLLKRMKRQKGCRLFHAKPNLC